MRNLSRLLSPSRRKERDDSGFSFAQVIVTMVIVGILGGVVGFAAFQYIGQARETVLSANIQTAAEAVQNTLALNPGLKAGMDTATGAPSAALISELSSAAAFTWNPDPTGAPTYAWEFQPDDGVETVRIQMLVKAAADDTDANANADGVDAATDPPEVRWLVDNGDAVRIQIRNDDGAWACALIVLRPDWNDAMVAGTTSATQEAAAEGNLRGTWYDAGAALRDIGLTGASAVEVNGRHHCSPTTVADHNLTDTTMVTQYGYTAATGVNGQDPLPVNGANWAIPYDVGLGAGTIIDDNGASTADDGAANGTGDNIVFRLLQRSVPGFDAT